MNAPESTCFLPDIQSQGDNRGLRTDAVGVKEVRHPAMVQSGRRVQSTIANFAMVVGLPAAAKGTHMSRFVEVLEAQTEALDRKGLERLLLDMLSRLEARSGSIEMRFPYFARKTAPVSGAQSQLDYEVCWSASRFENEQLSFRKRVTVPVTSLCPCSKEISTYGAHNQRSHFSTEAELAGEMAIDALIASAEGSASCDVYGLLNRPDEKFVAERAYDNPKFVEDLVRDVAIALKRELRVRAYVVEAENFESIHDHSAFARIARTGPAAASALSDERWDQHPQSALMRATR